MQQIKRILIGRVETNNLVRSFIKFLGVETKDRSKKKKWSMNHDTMCYERLELELVTNHQSPLDKKQKYFVQMHWNV